MNWRAGFRALSSDETQGARPFTSPALAPTKDLFIAPLSVLPLNSCSGGSVTIRRVRASSSHTRVARILFPHSRATEPVSAWI